MRTPRGFPRVGSSTTAGAAGWERARAGETRSSSTPSAGEPRPGCRDSSAEPPLGVSFLRFPVPEVSPPAERPCMKLVHYALTDRGRRRTQNEDSLLADEALGLFIVADGMG